MATDLQSHKLQLSNVKNLSPTFTNADGNNGTQVISKHNALVDAVQASFDTIETSLFNNLLNYPTSEPAQEWESNLVQLWVNATTGNDTTGNGTVGTPYKTLSRAIQHASTKKFVRKGSTLLLHLTGTFAESMDLSGIVVDIYKTVNGTLATESDLHDQSYVNGLNIQLMNNESSSTRNFTVIPQPGLDSKDNFIRIPKIKRYNNDISYSVNLIILSGNISAETIPLTYYFDSSHFLYKKCDLTLLGCDITDTTTNGWTNLYVQGLNLLQITEDTVNNNLQTIFTTNSDQWSAIELSECYRFNCWGVNGQNVVFNNYAEPITIYSPTEKKPLIANILFNNVGYDDIYFNKNDSSLLYTSGCTFNKGIYVENVNQNISIKFSGSIPTGEVLLSYALTGYSIKKVITKCGTGSFTFNLNLNGNTVPISSNSATTTKTEHDLTGLRIAARNSEIKFTDVTGNATDVLVIIVVEAEFDLV